MRGLRRDVIASRLDHGVRELDVDQVHHVVDFPPLCLESCLSERASVWEQGCDDCVEFVRGGHRFGEPLEGCLCGGPPLGNACGACQLRGNLWIAS